MPSMSVRSHIARSGLPPGRWYKLLLTLQACTEVSRGQRNRSLEGGASSTFKITIVFRSLFLAIASCCRPVVGDGEESVLIPKFQLSFLLIIYVTTQPDASSLCLLQLVTAE